MKSAVPARTPVGVRAGTVLRQRKRAARSPGRPFHQLSTPNWLADDPAQDLLDDLRARINLVDGIILVDVAVVRVKIVTLAIRIGDLVVRGITIISLRQSLAARPALVTILSRGVQPLFFRARPGG